MTTQTEHRPTEPGRETPGEAIRRLLDADERNLTWLSRKTGLSVGHLFRVTTGERPVTANLASKLAEVFGVQVETFVQGEEE